jgi:hypothetical protein
MQLLKCYVIVFVEDGLSFYGFSPGKILTFDKFFIEPKRGFCLFIGYWYRQLYEGPFLLVWKRRIFWGGNTLVFVDIGQRETLLSLVLSVTIILESSTSVVVNDASAQKVVYADQHDFTCLIVVGFDDVLLGRLVSQG